MIYIYISLYVVVLLRYKYSISIQKIQNSKFIFLLLQFLDDYERGTGEILTMEYSILNMKRPI